MNNNDINYKLINAYKNAKKLILQDPNNKKNIVKEFIDLVLKLNNCQQSSNNKSTSTDINIYNNFNNTPNNMMNSTNNLNKYNKNNYIDITKTSEQSILELASTFNYMN